MKNEIKNRKFWDRYAKFYETEILRFSGRAYKYMYQSMEKVLTKEMKALEIATGTGLIAINIAEYVHSIEAIDFSPKMIETVRKKKVPNNVHFLWKMEQISPLLTIILM